MRKMRAKLCKAFSTFCKLFLKQFVWMLDVEKCRTVMLNIAKTLKLLSRKETSDVLSDKNVRND